MVTATAMLAAGCTGDDAPGADDGDVDGSGTGTAVTATPSPSAVPSPTTPAPTPQDDASSPPEETAAGDGALPVATPDLDEQCLLEPDLPDIDTISYAVPSSWMVEGRCDVLDPDLDELPERSTEFDAALFVGVADIPFDQVAASGPATKDVTRWLGARAGHQAVRETGVRTGEALGEAGQRVTHWAVDLDPGTDEHGGVLTLATGAGDDTRHERASTVLDLIAQTIIISPAADGAGERSVVVTRSEGGESPYAVTWDGQCFALRPGGPTDPASDELCDLDPTSGELVTGMLGKDVLVGHAPPLTVALRLDGGASPFGLASGTEGSAVFGFRVTGDAGELTALAAGGAPIATGPVG